MFAEQPSVKLCCQLCCSVFKDPVITTCGVRLPLPDLCTTVRPLSWAALASLTGLVWPPSRCPLQWARGEGSSAATPQSAHCLHSTPSVEDAP